MHTGELPLWVSPGLPPETAGNWKVAWAEGSYMGLLQCQQLMFLAGDSHLLGGEAGFLTWSVRPQKSPNVNFATRRWERSAGLIQGHIQIQGREANFVS